MKALNQTPFETVNNRGCESENFVEITFQIFTINSVSLRAGWATGIHLLMCINHCY